MKFLIVVLAITIMVQASMAGSLRFKRSSEVEEGLMEYLTFSKNLVNAAEGSVKGTLKEMPKTEAYSAYRKDLEELQKDIEEFSDTPGNCFAKTFTIMFELAAFIMEHGSDDATEEAKHVFELLHKHGSDDVRKEFAAWQEKYSDQKMDPKLQKMSAEEALAAVKPFFTAVC